MGSFTSQLLAKIPDYQSRGILDAESAKSLTEELTSVSLVEKARRKLVIKIFSYAVGVFVMALGARLVFGNLLWDYLSIHQRAIVAFIPLVLSAIFGTLVLLKSDSWGGKRIFREIAALLSATGAICALCVCNSIYLLDIKTADICFALFVLTFPMTLIFRSGISALAGMILLFTCAINFNYSQQSLYIVTRIGLLAMFLAEFAWLIWTFKKNPDDKVFYPAIFVFLVCGAKMLYFISGIAPMFWELFCAGFYSILWLVKSRSTAMNSMICLVATFSVLFNFLFNYHSKFTSWSEVGSESFELFICYAIAFSVVFVYFFIERLRAKSPRAIDIAFSLQIIFALLFFFGVFGSALFSSLYFAIVLFAIFVGVRNASYLYANIGFFLLIGISIIEFSHAQISDFYRAFLLVFVGAILIASNIYISRKAKNEN